MSSRKYMDLKPTEIELKSVYADFLDLERLLLNHSSTYDSSGVYYLNHNKWFAAPTVFHNTKIKHPVPNVELSSITVSLSKSNMAVKRKLDFRHKPKNVYGRDKLTEDESQYFDRGHLIADCLTKYAQKFCNYKWQNFVMITDWCNRANTERNGDKSFGMFHFEEIVKDAVKCGAVVKYRVTPVFKELESGEYEAIPRGIILEAKCTNGKKFSSLNSSEFNVFIPNAQKGVVIDYQG